MISQVFSNAESGASLFSGEVKIILSALDASVAKKIFRGIDNLKIYFCTKVRDSVLLYEGFVEPRRCPVVVPFPPSFCLGMIALSSEGEGEIDYLRKIWAAQSESFLPPVMVIQSHVDYTVVASQVYRLLFESSLQLSSGTAKRLVNLHQQFASFRLVHEQLHNAFDTVENFLSRSQLPPMWLGFASEPKDEFIGPIGADESFEVFQTLPCPSQGMGAIEFFTCPRDASARGALVVRVMAQEDGRILGSWRVPYQLLREDWQWLDLPEIDIATRQSVLLSISWQSLEGSPPHLALSALQPVPESRVRANAPVASERSLALRVHLGLPGARRVAHPWQVCSDRGNSNAFSGAMLPLAPSVLQNFVEVGADTKRGALATLIAERDAIEVRAPQHDPTVVKLPASLPAGVNQLTATIKSGPGEGTWGEHAVFALAQEHDYKNVLKEGRVDIQSGAFSGWLPVKQDWITQIHVQLEKPPDAPLDIYLATRRVRGGAAQPVVAQWRDFLVKFDDIALSE